MPVPKKRHPKGRTRRRRGGHKKIKLPNLVVCKSCKKLKEPHVACPYCGNYK
ncbi:50S ribosomal protein L32 [Candidatus Woesebacteria bacterium]|nr:50S ribosomal protein L32 [Candidatus Woesebacteria bacterium]